MMFNAATMTALHALVPAAQASLMYLGVGALLWFAILIMAMVMR